ncbi:hypothetical protein HNQ93_003855 [Hymenobacter luteus]|uniref:Uncharacterized protein n=2 Tax=Hymenobacter TaxID=89966 RepID=A0A7W9T5V0_9BACT|nr:MULTISPECIES: hypothetical protein [Hymenobacter]MBB4603062.1 hypothetical protein [Hymenobacter latericoloratus]MBB6060979.1 hypothetical protein [Hymenobacter luteus]
MLKARTFWLAAVLLGAGLSLTGCNGDKGRDANTETTTEASGDVDSNGSADINGYPDATSDSLTAGTQAGENNAQSRPDETKGAGSPETTVPVGTTSGSAGTTSGAGGSTGSTTGGQ